MEFVSLLGAPTGLGLKPYDDTGAARAVSQAPAVLRKLGLAGRIHARDRGDVVAASYRDYDRPAATIRNEAAILEHAYRLADAIPPDGFTLLLGGDCSVLLGALRGLRRRTPRLGLAFIDGHADFNIAPLSPTGAVAGMDLALAVGRGNTPLAQLAGIAERDVVAIGRRDHEDQQWLGEHAIGFSEIRDLPCEVVHERGAAAIANEALERLGALDGFFIHLDADVLDPSIMPAVDSPEPDGLSLEQLADVLRPLVHHPRALGLELTIYDPGLDPDRSCGRRLVDLLSEVLR